MACSQFSQDKKAEKQMSCPTQNTAALNHTKNIELKKKPLYWRPVALEYLYLHSLCVKLWT